MRRWLLAMTACGLACGPSVPTSTDRPRAAPVSGASAAPQARALPPPSLQGHALFTILEDVLALPRWLGAPERETGIRELVRMAEARGATVTRQPFAGHDPLDGQSYALENIYASVRPRAPHQFVLATHFDVRPWAEEDPDPRRRNSPIPGANDGTSGVAVLLGLLVALDSALPSEVGFTVIFFDGEELGRPTLGGYCAGSRYLAAHPVELPENMKRAAFGIVLDMVGDTDLQIAIEPRSSTYNPELVEELWSAAARIGAPAFVAREGRTAIIDDHVGLTDAGIPSVLLIDYDYPAWHTHQDTIARVSAQSLETVAHVVYEAVLRRYAPPLAPVTTLSSRPSLGR